MLIRLATPTDIPQIRRLEQQADTAAHWAEQGYQALFAPEAPKRIALVAVQEEVQGFIIVRCALGEWEIENVVVAAERRRAGIGSALLREILRQAQRDIATSVLLEVRESNKEARRMYEKLGFSEVGRRSQYYQNPVEDALLLKYLVSFS